MEKLLRTATHGFLVATVFLTGCEATQDVAVKSFRVIDAPAAYIRRQIDSPDRTTTTTTTETTVSSDAYQPGHPVVEAPPPPPQRYVTRERAVAPSRPSSSNNPPSRTTVRRDAEARPRPAPSASPRVTAAQPPVQPAQIPYAKPVPGKAGYVFSPFDPNGGYVDVNGYTPGSKVKDPYSGKIFLVP